MALRRSGHEELSCIAARSTASGGPAWHSGRLARNFSAAATSELGEGPAVLHRGLMAVGLQVDVGLLQALERTVAATTLKG
mmetsp:Transcript_17917/g.34986  ORF Transcript_17917/g.34986 Transcript_17917/m.34986 type:complete len:81 (+) Transcript_17917:208-450(+)